MDASTECERCVELRVIIEQPDYECADCTVRRINTLVARQDKRTNRIALAGVAIFAMALLAYAWWLIR